MTKNKPSKKTKDYPKLTVEMLSTGCFMVYQNTGGFFGNLIENHQLKMGLSKEDAKYVHIDVLGPRNYAIRVNPPRAKIVDILEYYKGRPACMVRFKAPNYQKKRVYVAWWAVSNNNKLYDFWGVLKFKLAWMWHKKNLYFCSENAAWALKQEYPGAFDGVKAHKIMPGHFRGPQFEILWEGIIE